MDLAVESIYANVAAQSQSTDSPGSPLPPAMDSSSVPFSNDMESPKRQLKEVKQDEQKDDIIAKKRRKVETDAQIPFHCPGCGLSSTWNVSQDAGSATCVKLVSTLFSSSSTFRPFVVPVGIADSKKRKQDESDDKQDDEKQQKRSRTENTGKKRGGQSRKKLGPVNIDKTKEPPKIKPSPKPNVPAISATPATPAVPPIPAIPPPPTLTKTPNPKPSTGGKTTTNGNGKSSSSKLANRTISTPLKEQIDKASVLMHGSNMPEDDEHEMADSV